MLMTIRIGVRPENGDSIMNLIISHVAFMERIEFIHSKTGLPRAGTNLNFVVLWFWV